MFEQPLWFESWEGLGRVVVVSVAGYIALIFILRVSGKRTLSKMNAFDFVITIAFGSVFATLMLSRSTTVGEGVTAFAMLALLQYIVAWLSARSDRFQRLVKSQPSLLFFQGQMLYDTMKRERVTKEEVHMAMRTGGYRDKAEVAAVVLETDGTMHVLAKRDTIEEDTLYTSGIESPHGLSRHQG